MARYSVQPNIEYSVQIEERMIIIVILRLFLSFGRNIGKNISKKVKQ